MIIFSLELKSHVKEIDEQHQWLFDLINAFDSVGKGIHSDDEIEEMLTGLNEYVAEHFTYEEGLMVESGYPDFDWHHNWHRGYILKLERLKEEFILNGVSEEFDYILREFVEKWIVTHIRNVDTSLGTFINEVRVSAQSSEVINNKD